MANSKPKSKYWGRPTNAPIHPYVEFEGTPLWRTVKKAIADLDKNHDVELTEWYQYVVGYVCRQLVRGKVVTGAAKRKIRDA